MKYYTLEACEKLISKFADIENSEINTIDEGVLGLGLMVLTAPNKKTAIIREIYVNAWSSTHSVTLYNKTPKKYLKLIESL